jgi:hypothetical protein
VTPAAPPLVAATMGDDHYARPQAGDQPWRASGRGQQAAPGGAQMSEMRIVSSNREQMSRDTLGGGAVAGLAGGIAVSIFMAIGAALRGQDLWIGFKMAAYPFLHERVMSPGFDAPAVAAGLFCHFTVSVIWGVLFAVAVYGLSKAATIGLGALWGIVVWLGMFYLVLPLVGMGGTAQKVPVGGAITEHVLFGLVMGLAFVPFQEPQLAGHPWWWHRQAPTPAH